MKTSTFTQMLAGLLALLMMAPVGAATVQGGGLQGTLDSVRSLGPDGSLDALDSLASDGSVDPVGTPGQVGSLGSVGSPASVGAVDLETVLDQRLGEKFPVEVHDRLADPILRDGLMQTYYVGDVDLERLDGRFVVLYEFRAIDGALVLTDMEGFELLARHPSVSFLTPDHRVEYHTAEGSVTVGARSVPGAKNDGPAIWKYDAATDSLVSDTTDLGFADVITGDSVTVASIDSGIDRTHNDFGGWDCDPQPYQPCDSRIDLALKVSHMISGDEGVDEGGTLPTTEAASGHGTHTAGTIAGNAWYARQQDSFTWAYGADDRPFGMAPEARLISLSVGDGPSAGFATIALDWLAHEDNADRYNVRVASNSWGCQNGCAYNANAATSLLIKDLYNQGVAVVFSAGNSGSAPNTMGDNAKNPWALGVANFDDDSGNLAAGSSRGNEDDLPAPATWTPEGEDATADGRHHNRPDLTAPGSGIWAPATLTGGSASLWPRVDPQDAGVHDLGPTTAYALMGGTSMAAPHVSGIAALLFDACPQATPLDVYRGLKQSALESDVTVSPSAPRHAGYGVPDARLALGWMAQNVASCTGGEVPLTVALSDKTVTEGDGVTLSAGLSGGDGSAPAWQWTLTPPAGSTAVLSDATAARPTFTADVPGDYGVTVQVTVGDEVATDVAVVTAEEDVRVTATTLYLGSTGPTFVGTVDQQLEAQPLNTATPPDEGAAIAYDNPLINNVQPDSVAELVWSTPGDITLQDQEVTATIWVEHDAPLNAAGLCGGSIDLELWNNNGAWNEIATTELVYGSKPVNALFKVSGSFGVVPAASGPLTLVINAGSSDCDAVTGIWYDDLDYPSRIEIMEPVDTNAPPTADAGADQTVDEGTDAGLDGTGSSDDGAIVSYAWAQTAGPTVTLEGADTATPSFAAPEVDADTTLTFGLTVTDDEGATDTDSVDVTVVDTTPYEPQITIIDPVDGATIEDPAAGLDVAGDYDPAVQVESTSMSTDLPIGWQDPSQGGNGDYVFVDSPGSGSLVEGVTALAGRAGSSDTDPDCETDCGGGGGDPIEFGEPQSDHLRPGDWSVSNGAACTLNFVYEYQARYFFGSAAHCAGTGGNTNTNGCTTQSRPIGSTVTLRGNSQTVTATLAYSSWATMQANNEGNSNACFGNDFALFEVSPEDHDKIHPAVRMYGGPTGLGSIGSMSTLDDIRGYGRSSLHDDTFLLDPEGSVLNPKNGYYLGQNNGGWSYWVYLLPQGIPGDSGGGIMDMEGNALGAASTISALGGTNNYANIERALAYMEDKEGWAPGLVTWEAFDPDPRVSMVTGSDGAPAAPASSPVSGPLALMSGLLGLLGPATASDPGDDGVVPGVYGEALDLQLSDDGTDLHVELDIGGALNAAVAGSPVTWYANFTATHNGVVQDYRLTYANNAENVALGVVGAGGSNFGMQTRTHPDATDVSTTCEVDADLSKSRLRTSSSDPPNNDGSTWTIEWIVPLAEFDHDARGTRGADGCAGFTRNGEGLGEGDALRAVVGGTLISLGVATASGGGANDVVEGDDHTVGGCTDCSDFDVAFTVNDVDAGGTNFLADGTWTHDIDFAAFDADAAGRYKVVATHGTATETVVYEGPEADPCATFADRIVVTLGGHTACIPYDPAAAGPWEASFDDLSDLDSGAYALTATAYDSAGQPLDEHTVTVHVGAADQDDDGVPDDEDNCPETANPGQEDLEGDGIGDACDDDRDGDGVPNDEDAFPDDGSEWADSDGDGVGDNSDACPGHDDGLDTDGDGVPNHCDDDVDGDGQPNDRDADSDGDGHPDGKENAFGTDPYDPNSHP